MKVNELELRVYGLMRSGNSAILGWMLDLYPNEKVCFLNNVGHGDADPYQSCRKIEHFGFATGATVEEIRREPKRLLIYSYEDHKRLQKADTAFLDSVFDPAFEERREEYLGTSRKRRNVLILRDPFNCLASRMLHIRERGLRVDLNDLKAIANDWKIIARRALENDPANDDLVILYNNWVGSKSYRKKLAANLGGRSTEGADSSEILQTVDGSSGKSRKKAKGPSRFRRLMMRVRRLWAWVTRSPIPVVDSSDDQYMRWAVMRKDEQYRELFKDPEMLQLSRALFGDIPGTGMFARRLWDDAESAETAVDHGDAPKATQ